MKRVFVGVLLSMCFGAIITFMMTLIRYPKHYVEVTSKSYRPYFLGR